MVTPHTMRSSMMHGGESHTEALGQMRPLVHPKNVMKIGNYIMVYVRSVLHTVWVSNVDWDGTLDSR